MCLKTLVHYGPPSQARPRRWTESWTGHLVAGKQKRYTWKDFPGGKKSILHFSVNPKRWRFTCCPQYAQEVN